MALTDNLLAFYKLDNTNDSSGNNRTLTNNGNVSFASGKIGNAAVFDQGSLSRDASFLANTSELSISCWYKNSSNGPIFSIWGGESNDFSLISNGWGDGTAVGMGFNTDSGGGYYNFSNGSGVPQDEQYHHVVMVYSSANSSFKAFVDGNVVGSESITGALCTSGSLSQLVLGAQTDSINEGSGSMDAVGIWNRALSDSEVTALYNNGTGLELPEAPAVKNGWIDNIFWINDVATTLDQNGDGKWQGKLYEGGTLFSGTKYSLTFVDGLAQAENIVTVIGTSIPVAFGLNEAEEPLVELVFASITSAGETTVEQIVPTVLPTGYTVAETVLAYSIDTTATFEGSINVDFILPSNISQAVFDRVKGFHVKNSGAIEEMARVSSDFSTKRITVAITSFSDFLFLDEPQGNKTVKVVGKSKFVGKIKFA